MRQHKWFHFSLFIFQATFFQHGLMNGQPIYNKPQKVSVWTTHTHAHTCTHTVQLVLFMSREIFAFGSKPSDLTSPCRLAYWQALSRLTMAVSLISWWPLGGLAYFLNKSQKWLMLQRGWIKFVFCQKRCNLMPTSSTRCGFSYIAIWMRKPCDKWPNLLQMATWEINPPYCI